MRDYYYILGIEYTATEKEIKTAYRKLSLKFHPDKNNDEKFFEERFKEIQEAYEILSNSRKRQDYNSRLNHFNATHINRDNLKNVEEDIRRKFEEEFRKREEEMNRKFEEKEKKIKEDARKGNPKMANNPPKKKIQKPNQGKKDARQQKSGMSKEWWFLLGLVAVTFIAFFPSLNNGFVNWDDFNYVRDNAIIKDLSSKNIGHIFKTSTFVMGNYHPFTVMTYCFEYSLFKLNPFYYHLDNILLHLINVVLVYVFIKMLLEVRSSKPEVEKSSYMIAAITATLFALHPLRVESVTWVAERKDVLYTLFFLGSLIYYIKNIKSSKTKYYVLSLVFFLFSILSKGQAVVLAPVLLLIDYFAKGKFDRKLILEKIPFFLLALIFGIVAMQAQHTSLTTSRLAEHTPLERLMIASYGLIMYLYKFVLPIKLACFYQYPDTIKGFFFITPLAVIGLLFGVWRLFLNAKRSESVQSSKFNVQNALIFGSLFFLVTISIVLQLLPVGDAVIAERYTYIPFIGLFFFVSSIFVNLYETKPNLRTALRAIGIVVLLAFTVQTFAITMVWKNSTTLWSHVLKNSPETPVALNNRGQSYFDMPGLLDKSLDSLKKVEAGSYKRADFIGKINTDFGADFNEQNITEDNIKKVKDTFYEKAFNDFNKAISLKKDYFYAFKNRGAVYQNLKKYELAVADYKRAIAISPNFSSAMFNLGLNYVDMEKPDSALIYYDMAEANNPDNVPEIYYSKGIAYKKLNKPEQAIENYSKAIQTNPLYNEAFDNRGNVYFNLGQFDRAIEDYNRSIQINPNNGRAYSNRSMAYFSKKDYKSAMNDAMQAQALGTGMDPRYIEILKSQK